MTEHCASGCIAPGQWGLHAFSHTTTLCFSCGQASLVHTFKKQSPESCLARGCTETDGRCVARTEQMKVARLDARGSPPRPSGLSPSTQWTRGRKKRVSMDSSEWKQAARPGLHLLGTVRGTVRFLARPNSSRSPSLERGELKDHES